MATGKFVIERPRMCTFPNGSTCKMRSIRPSLTRRDRLLGVGFAACLLSGCLGYGMAYKEPIDFQYRYLDTELNAGLGMVFRPSRYALMLDSLPKYGAKTWVDFKGTIPYGHAQVKERNLCNRRKNPYCWGITFGEQLLAQPQVIAEMNDWLTHVCERLPVTVTDKLTYHSVDSRRSSLRALRASMGCDGAPKEPRQLHVFVVRDFDNVFSGDAAHTDAVLRQSIIADWVVIINP